MELAEIDRVVARVGSILKSDHGINRPIRDEMPQGLLDSSPQIRDCLRHCCHQRIMRKRGSLKTRPQPVVVVPPTPMKTD